ncbi:MAG: permease [Halieaceae bacterium]|jgi:uncharacterized membrane protein YraQ (UPF0718 family)|nr:permease [Halieaceae bacterium]
MNGFLEQWHQAAITATGLFWTAFWAFALGYFVSSLIQVLVSARRMRQVMGEEGPRSVALGAFFGFISSSCSFAALSGTRALFAKGAGLVPSLAFLLASTNLVVELGIIIAVFLGWQFVVGEYLGGLLLILLMWLLVKATRRLAPVYEAREIALQHEENSTGGGNDSGAAVAMFSAHTWRQIAGRYVMEWGMVWKDVTVGFTVAGAIAVFVPVEFFEALFIGGQQPQFLDLLAQTVVGPIAAFFTFIGSMGNIPLAAVLYGNGVAFGGIMAFIFSDLVVLPVLRVNARYYGWRMSLYILMVLLVALVATSLTLHYGFAALDLLPTQDAVKQVVTREYFRFDYTLWLNIVFLLMSGGLFAWKSVTDGISPGMGPGLVEKTVFCLAMLCYLWLALGLVMPVLQSSLNG